MSKEHSKFRRDACYSLGMGDLVDEDKIRVNKGASQYNAASLISSRSVCGRKCWHRGTRADESVLHWV
jgi:hypothetical protein